MYLVFYSWRSFKSNVEDKSVQTSVVLCGLWSRDSWTFVCLTKCFFSELRVTSSPTHSSQPGVAKRWNWGFCSVQLAYLIKPFLSGFSTLSLLHVVMRAVYPCTEDMVFTTAYKGVKNATASSDKKLTFWLQRSYTHKHDSEFSSSVKLTYFSSSKKGSSQNQSFRSRWINQVCIHSYCVIIMRLYNESASTLFRKLTQVLLL